MIKRCKICNIEKPISEFHKMNGCLYGVRTTCKECRKTERKEYSKLPHVIEKNKNYYQNNKEVIRKRLNDYYWTLTCQYHEYLKRSKKSKIEFNLSKGDCKNFYNVKCYYCGEDYKGLGIDRIDNNLGYIVENVRPCCKFCNFMKHTSTEFEFYNRILKIYNNLNLITRKF